MLPSLFEASFGFRRHLLQRNQVVADLTPATGWDDNSANFGSDHVGGAHFVFTDGSVHFLSENMNFTVYQQLSDKADGNVVSFP